MTPTKKLKQSVTDVMVTDTAASLNVSAIRSSTGAWMLVLLQAPNMTKVSSIPMPSIKNGAAMLMPMKGIPQYMINPMEAEKTNFQDCARGLMNFELKVFYIPIVAKTAETTPKRPSKGLDLTQSVIIQVKIQNTIIRARLNEK